MASTWHRGAWLELERTEAHDTGVIGRIIGCLEPIALQTGAAKQELSKELCKTVERPWADNKRSVSCIPDGIYPLSYKRSGRFFASYNKSSGHEFILEIIRVPDGRYAILIHKANDPMTELRGCVAPVTKAELVNGRVWGERSGKAYDLMMAWVFRNRPAYIKVSGLDTLIGA